MTVECIAISKNGFWRILCSCIKCASAWGSWSLGTTCPLCIWTFWERWKQGNCHWRTSFSKLKQVRVILQYILEKVRINILSCQFCEKFILFVTFTESCNFYIKMRKFFRKFWCNFGSWVATFCVKKITGFYIKIATFMLAFYKNSQNFRVCTETSSNNLILAIWYFCILHTLLFEMEVLREELPTASEASLAWCKCICT